MRLPCSKIVCVAASRTKFNGQLTVVPIAIGITIKRQ
jgi:hypothetical protein